MRRTVSGGGMAARALLAVALAIGAVLLIGYRNARADPVVRRMAVKLPGWPAGAAPVTVALLSDIHIGSPATDAARLARVVAQVNALHPDLVLIAGDFVAGHDPAKGRAYAARLTRPLAGLRAPLGTVAVLGNHDHWTAPAEVRRALERADITVLANTTVARGPLAVVGIDDGFSGHADPARALASARLVRGARVVLTHTPDTAAALPAGAAAPERLQGRWKHLPVRQPRPTEYQSGSTPVETALALAGHTHCGQAVLPVIGSLAVHRYGQALYDPRYECGAVRDPGRLVIVTGGIGGSLPLRYGAPPDVWLLTLGP